MRHRGLCARAFGDALCLLSLGRRAILRALLRIRHIFSRSDTHYLLGRLFFDDYCIWVQKVPKGTLTQFAAEATLMLESTGVRVIADSGGDEAGSADAWSKWTNLPLAQLESLAAEFRRDEVTR